MVIDYYALASYFIIYSFVFFYRKKNKRLEKYYFNIETIKEVMELIKRLR